MRHLQLTCFLDAGAHGTFIAMVMELGASGLTFVPSCFDIEFSPGLAITGVGSEQLCGIICGKVYRRAAFHHNGENGTCECSHYRGLQRIWLNFENMLEQRATRHPVPYVYPGVIAGGKTSSPTSVCAIRLERDRVIFQV